MLIFFEVKRFNEEVSCAPAPNAYDSKLPRSCSGGVALVKSQRFGDAKVSVKFINIPVISVAELEPVPFGRSWILCVGLLHLR